MPIVAETSYSIYKSVQPWLRNCVVYGLDKREWSISLTFLDLRRRLQFFGCHQTMQGP